MDVALRWQADNAILLQLRKLTAGRLYSEPNVVRQITARERERDRRTITGRHSVSLDCAPNKH